MRIERIKDLLIIRRLYKMAKLGRYSADRKKIQSLTGAHTVTVPECGTIFVLNLAGGGTVTLPNASAAVRAVRVAAAVSCSNAIAIACGGAVSTAAALAL